MAAIEEALETCKDMAVRGSPVGSPLSDTENLRCAVTRDDFEVLKRNLIGIGQSEQLFLLAAQQGKARSIAYFLDLGVNMNERDVNGSTALILASGAGHAELVRILLVRGVDVPATIRCVSTEHHCGGKERRQQARRNHRHQPEVV